MSPVTLSDRLYPGDLPQEVMAQITCHLLNYLVVLIGLEPVRGQETVGSGTLVTYKGKFYILTADHVWHSLKKFDEIGLTIAASPHRTAIRRDAFNPILVAERGVMEWGPDIMFLGLPENVVSSFNVRKSFYPLDGYLRDKASGPSNGSVVVPLAIATGVPWEECFYEGHRLHLAPQACFTRIEDEIEHGGFDYRDVEANYNVNTTLPSTFGGFSGGGLWIAYLDQNLAWDENMGSTGFRVGWRPDVLLRSV